MTSSCGAAPAPALTFDCDDVIVNIINSVIKPAGCAEALSRPDYTINNALPIDLKDTAWNSALSATSSKTNAEFDPKASALIPNTLAIPGQLSASLANRSRSLWMASTFPEPVNSASVEKYKKFTDLLADHARGGGRLQLQVGNLRFPRNPSVEEVENLASSNLQAQINDLIFPRNPSVEEVENYEGTSPESQVNSLILSRDPSVEEAENRGLEEKSPSESESGSIGGTGVKVVQGRSVPQSGLCRVCGDQAHGMYFGALVCVPCKTFFLRYAGEDFSYECKYSKDCKISVETRTHCKHCRYQKCLAAGMQRRVRPVHVQATEGQQLCVVCKDIGNGIHFGAVTCEGCKKFFRRGLKEHTTYSCKVKGNCPINPRTRNSCRYCRFQKCAAAGMSREAIQMGRPSKMLTEINRTMAAKSQNPDDEVFSTEPVPNLSVCITDNRKNTFAKLRIANELLGLESRKRTAGDLSGNPNSLWLDSSNLSSKLSRISIPDPVSLQKGMFPIDLSSIRDLAFGMPQTLQNHPEYSRASSQISSEPYFKMTLASTKPSSDSCAAVGTINESSEIKLMMDKFTETSDSSVALPQSLETQQLPLLQQNSPQEQSQSTQMQSLVFHQQQPLESQKQPQPLNFQLQPTLDFKFIPDVSKDCHATPFRKRWKCIERTQSESDATPSERHGETLLTAHQETQVKKLYDTIFSISRPRNCAAQVVEDLITASNQMNVSSLPNAQLKRVLIDTIRCSTEQQSDICGQFVLLKKLVDSQKENESMGMGMETVVSSTAMSSELQGMDIYGMYADLLHQPNQNVEAENKNGCDFFKVDVYSMPPADDEQLTRTRRYWLQPSLPDEQVLLAGTHWEVINRIVPAYNNYVSVGTNVNKTLRDEFDKWWQVNCTSDDETLLPKWIQARVIPAYTVLSVTYCKSLPDFTSFDYSDQMTIILLGQATSRILVGAYHWYDSEKNNFRNFLCWREPSAGRVDSFKHMLFRYSEGIARLDLDSIEAALLNALIIIASDYPHLKNPGIIEKAREKIVATFQAYITAKLGTPNNRLQTLFRCIPEVRRLGLLHHHMTETRMMTAEEVTQN